MTDLADVVSHLDQSVDDAIDAIATNQAVIASLNATVSDNTERLEPIVDTVFPPQRIIFVTSETYQAGEIGSTANADAECAKLAEDAGLPAVPFKAWLSTHNAQTDMVSTRFDDWNTLTSNDPYVLVNGTVIATNWHDIYNIQPAFEWFYGINLDENGDVVSGYAWTGTSGKQPR